MVTWRDEKVRVSINKYHVSYHKDGYVFASDNILYLNISNYSIFFVKATIPKYHQQVTTTTTFACFIKTVK